MDNKEKILQLIVEEGEKEAQLILKEAEEEKNRILSEAKKNADEKRSSIEREMEIEIEGIKKRGESQWGIEGRNMLLKKKRDLISEIFKDIENKLEALGSNEKLDWYANIFDKYYASGKAELLLNEKDKKAFGDDFLNKISNKDVVLSEKTGSFAGGFILIQDKTEINCTLDVLVEEERKKYEGEVAKLLFGKDSI